MKRKKTNHCTWSPDGIGKYYWGDACKRHDKEYRSYPKNMTREEADLKFLKELKNKMPFEWLAYFYYYVVRLISKPGWERWKYHWLGILAIKRRQYR